MANMHDVRSGMQVIGSDGGMIGTVSGIEGDQIAVTSAGEHAGHHHHVPSSWVARVDDHVHLDRPAAVAATEPDYENGVAAADSPDS